MSIENLKEYMQLCIDDPKLRAQAGSIGLYDLAPHIEASEKLGLSWTIEDMLALRKELLEGGEDLEDIGVDELEEVAGGIVSSTAMVAAVTVTLASMTVVAAGGSVAAMATMAGEDPSW